MTTRGLRVRPAAVAGTFYPARDGALAATIDTDLADARERGRGTDPASRSAARPKALVVPHAGYVYSGPVAATAYARLAPWRSTIRRVVLLGPAHRVPVRSMALSGADLWETPLGTVPIDVDGRERVARLPGVVVDDAAHAPEHSLEVQVPFLQRVLDDGWTLLPIVVGQASPEDVAAALDAVWGGDETLVVVSSDLSHYLDYRTAQDRDRATAAAMVDLRVDALDPHDACGAHPVRGLLTAARRHHLRVELLDLRNSGDTAGPPDRVVGYGAFQLVAEAPTGDDPTTTGDFDADERETMLATAEEAIRAGLEGRPARPPDPATVTAALRADGASFVTLRDGDRLLGCIGSITPHRPLLEDVADNAFGAAFRDPRMPALQPDEFIRMSLHVSVLTPLEPMAVRDLADLAAQVVPGRDGLLVEAGRHRGTFLPSVWEQLPDVDTFLAQLWRKAGLPPGTWPAGTRVSRYRSVEFGDDGPRQPAAG